MGAAGAAGAIAGTVATSESPAAAQTRLGGIHIYTQIFTGTRHDQGTPWLVEANLTTGSVHGVEVNADMGTELVFEGKGVVVRI
jgi:hypothetical protein